MFAYRLAPAAEAAGWAVVTDRFLGLLGPEAGADVAAELYRLLDADATRMPDVLDALSAHDEVGRVAVIEVIAAGERVFSVAVRGDVAVEMGGVASTTLSGPGATNWISTEARGVGFLALALGAAAGDRDLPALPIRRGVVRTRSIAVDESQLPSADLQPSAEAAAPTRQIPVQRVLDRSESDASPAKARRTRAVLPAGTTPRPPDPVPAAPAPAVTPASAAEPAPAVTPASDAEPAPNPAPTGIIYLLPDGRELDAGVPVVFGRRPWAGTPDSTAVHVVAPSPNREISGMHLELAVVDGSVHARDLDSTNGTLVLADSRPPRLLQHGGTTTVGSGDILDLGEAFRVVISARS